jgi:hypothetical protein
VLDANILVPLFVFFTEPQIKTVRGSHFVDLVIAKDRRCTRAFVTSSYTEAQ